MQDDEIDHIAQANAVSQIPYNSRQQERACSQNAIVVARRAQKVIEHSQRGSYCQYYKKPTSKGPTFLQLPESDAAIFCINQIKEAANNGSLITKPECADCPCLGGLVDHVDAKTCEQVARAPAKARWQGQGFFPLFIRHHKECAIDNR